MPTLKFDNQPSKQQIAQLAGIDPNAVGLTQNADGTWTVQIASDAIGTTITDAQVQAIAATANVGFPVITVDNGVDVISGA